MEVVRGTATVADVTAAIERLDEIREETGSLLQAFDARYVAGERHLATAARLAERERSRGHEIVEDAALEFLLYVAAMRQLDRAMEIGLVEGDQSVVLAAQGGDARAAIEAAADALDLDRTTVGPDEEALAEWFGITGPERTATTADVEELVCERVALLVVER